MSIIVMNFEFYPSSPERFNQLIFMFCRDIIWHFPILSFQFSSEWPPVRRKL